MVQCVDNGFLQRTQISATIIAMICSESCRISRSLFKHAGPLLVNGQTVEATPLCPCSWFMKWMGWDGAAAVAGRQSIVKTMCKHKLQERSRVPTATKMPEGTALENGEEVFPTKGSIHACLDLHFLCVLQKAALRLMQATLALRSGDVLRAESSAW